MDRMSRAWGAVEEKEVNGIAGSWASLCTGGWGARPAYCLWVVCAVVVGLNHIELREEGRFSSHLPKLFITVLCAVSNI